MTEQYKGYTIHTFFSHKDMGFHFCIEKDGEEKKSNEEPYFYEENALAGAKEEVDRLVKQAV